MNTIFSDATYGLLYGGTAGMCILLALRIFRRLRDVRGPQAQRSEEAVRRLFQDVRDGKVEPGRAADFVCARASGPVRRWDPRKWWARWCCHRNPFSLCQHVDHPMDNSTDWKG